jgi:hypothetical protein
VIGTEGICNAGNSCHFKRHYLLLFSRKLILEVKKDANSKSELRNSRANNPNQEQ